MSTVDVWIDDAEMDWGPGPDVALRPGRDRRPRPRRRWGAIAAVLVVAGAGALAFVDLDRGGARGTAPPLRAPVDGSAAAQAPASVTLDAIAHCESRGDPAAVSADGQYRGKYQFDMATWQSVGGTGDPALAPEREQDRRARALAAQRGTQPWPVCGTATRAG